MKRFEVAILAVILALLTVVSCESAHEGKTPTPEEEVESFENAWVYNHNKVGPLTSTIWDAFIDTREVDFWHIYLSPVKDITFEEVADFMPVKITLPVYFPMDGTKVLLSEDRLIEVEYGREKWSGESSPKGYIKAAYDARNNLFEIRFSTAGKLKGYYCGALNIIE